jgi:hypothetical protein
MDLEKLFPSEPVRTRFRLIAAIVLSELLKINGEPLWLCLTGATSAVTIEAFDKLGLLVKSLDPKTLINKNPTLDFLPEMNKRTVLVKHIRVEDQDDLFSMLRDCYDGYLKRVLNAVDTREYHIRFNLVVSHFKKPDELGERFMIHRIEAGTAFYAAQVQVDDEFKTQCRDWLLSLCKHPLPLFHTKLFPNEPNPHIARRILKMGRLLALVDGKTAVDKETVETVVGVQR